MPLIVVDEPKKKKSKSPHKGPAVRKSGGGKGMTAGDAWSTQAGRALGHKRKKYGEDVSSKIGESRSHMPKEQDGKTQQQKKRRVPYH